MDEVTLDGVVYIKAAAIAKKFSYTADYVGQLCRAKKVDAHLVGRTWYVNPDSLTAYQSKKSTIKPVSGDEVRSLVTLRQNNGAESYEVPIAKKQVAPVLGTKTAKQLQATHGTAGIKSVTVSYSVDDAHLIPKIRTIDTKPHYVPVSPAEGQSVPVSVKEEQVSFSPEELPTVALQGGVTVTDVPDELPATPRFTAQKTSDTHHVKSDISSKNKAVSDTYTNSQRAPGQSGVAVSDELIRHKKRISIARKPVTASFHQSALSVQQSMSRTSAVKPHVRTIIKKTDIRTASLRDELNLQPATTSGSDRVRDAVSGVSTKAADLASARARQTAHSDVRSGVYFIIWLLLAIIAGVVAGYFLVISPSVYSVGIN